LPVKDLQAQLDHSGNVEEDMKLFAKPKTKRKLQASSSQTKQDSRKVVSPQVKRTKFTAPVESLKQKAAVKPEPKSAKPIAKKKMKGLLYNSVETPEQSIFQPRSGPVPSIVDTKSSIKTKDPSESVAILQHGPIPSTIETKKRIETEDVEERPKIKPQEEPDVSPEEETAADKELVSICITIH
jgi:hypothetical protein